MSKTEKIFKLDTRSVEAVSRKLAQQPARYDSIMKQRMTAATNIVWRTAHAKRPMISMNQMKAEGRSKRVSDPNAKAGVPVDTGRLQASIQKEVKRGKGLGSWIGRVFTSGVPYAGFVEYGTSKMRARPFMRPAVALTKDALKNIFGATAENKNA